MSVCAGVKSSFGISFDLQKLRVVTNLSLIYLNILSRTLTGHNGERKQSLFL